MIRDGKTYQIPSALQTGQKYGMTTLEHSLQKLTSDGAIDPGEMERQLAALGLREDDGTKFMPGLNGNGHANGNGATRPSAALTPTLPTYASLLRK